MDIPYIPSDETRAPDILAIVWTGTSIAIVLLALRFYCRLKIGALGLDDWVMLISVLLAVIGSSLTIQSVQAGAYRHFTSIPPQDRTDAVMWLWIVQTPWILNYGVSKVATGIMITRLMRSPSNKKWIKLIYGVMAITMAFAVVNLVLAIAQCSPVAALWDLSLAATATCIDSSAYLAFIYTACGWYIFVDFFLAALPATMIWQLKMSVKKRVGLSITLGLGIFAGVIGCAKIPAQRAVGANSDFTWAIYPIGALSTSEVFLIIYAGCAPTLKPLFDQVRGSRTGVSHGTYEVGADLSGRQQAGYNSDRFGVELGKMSEDEPRELIKRADTGAVLGPTHPSVSNHF